MAVRHGQYGSPLYKVWDNMKQRCGNPNNPAYENYGGRGISVCEEWQDDFQAFYDWAAKTQYKPGLFLDRRNNEGNYEPDNCRWVTRTKNNSNKRNTIRLTAYGETKTLVEWTYDDRCDVSYATLRYRFINGCRSAAALRRHPQ